MQKLAEICVRRPVFATMLVAALVVIGIVSFLQLGVDRYPRIESPVVSVTTSNPGATPESVEAEVTDRVEAAVAERVPRGGELVAAIGVAAEYADTGVVHVADRRHRELVAARIAAGDEPAAQCQ